MKHTQLISVSVSHVRQFVLLLFLILTVMMGHAQSRKDYKKEMKEGRGFLGQNVADSLISRSSKKGDYYFDFPNINKVDYYRNDGKLNRIKQLRKVQKEFDLIHELEEYIGNFGILNFSRDTELLWALAQLYEKHEAIDKAKAAYRLVLKHHPTKNAEQIEQFFRARESYNELTELERDFYVPLDYYYELVEYRKLIDTLRPPKSILTNMGDLVNTSRVPDYGPSINLKDDMMIFTKKTLDEKYIGPDVRYSENLYYSINYDGFWDEALMFPTPVNSSCNEGSACLSSDGKILYFTRCKVQDKLLDCSDCMGSCDIYMTSKLEDTWTKPVNLGVNVNSEYWDSHPSLSVTEDTLFFASDRKGGFGVSDIYFTYKDRKGRWQPAQNMGPIINTRGNEYSPFLNKTYNVFYFSSNGQLLNFDDLEHNKNSRTLDIYKCHKEDYHWLEPKNIGPLVNGKGDEYYFTIDSKAKNLYYARTEENASTKYLTDLFAFPVPMEAQPTATVTLSGILVDEETGDPYQGIVSVIDLENGIEVAPKNIREDGTYEFDLIDHTNYLLIIQGDEFFRIEKLFHLDGDTEIRTEATAVQNRKLRFTSIEFEGGKWDILPDMEEDLWNVINFLVDNPGFELVISGHTDSDGNANSNLILSQKRADAIKKYVVDKGFIDGSRITAIGYGDTKPIRQEEVTEEDKRINRRVEFEIRGTPNEDGESKDIFEDHFQVEESDDNADW